MDRHSAARFLVGLGILLGTIGSVAPVALGQEATPAATCAAVTPDANAAVVRRFFEEGVNTGNHDVFDEVVTPDVVYAGATVGDESGLAALKRIYGEALTGL